MANLNKVMLIGRLTRDPEVRTFAATGGKVANFGFAVNNRRKNASTGQWEDEPVFLDVKAFNREQGRKMADLVEQHFRKGQQFYIEGHLTFEQWESKTDGSKQSKLKIILDDFQFFEPRSEGGPAPLQSNGGSRFSKPTPAAPPRSQGFAPEPDQFADNGPAEEPEGPADDIPF